jgi:hypothetical protein
MLILTARVALYEIEINSTVVEKEDETIIEKDYPAANVDPRTVTPVNGESRLASSFENKESDESRAQMKTQRTFKLRCLVRVTTAFPRSIWSTIMFMLIVFSMTRLLLQNNLSNQVILPIFRSD